MDPYVQYKQGGLQWGWYLYGGNNQLVASAFGYSNKAGARKAFKRTREIMGSLVWEK